MDTVLCLQGCSGEVDRNQLFTATSNTRARGHQRGQETDSKQTKRGVFFIQWEADLRNSPLSDGVSAGSFQTQKPKLWAYRVNGELQYKHKLAQKSLDVKGAGLHEQLVCTAMVILI